MLLERFVNGRARSNAYVLAPESADAIIVDPGVGAAPKVVDLVTSKGLRPRAIILTHGHADHIWTARELSEAYDTPVYIHPSDLVWFEDPATGGNLRLFRIMGRAVGRARGIRPPMLETIHGPIEAADQRVEVLHTPGHTRGSVCFLVAGVCFSGDTVFNGNVGNTNFPGGNSEVLRESIRAKLLGLPDELRMLPGHGRETTVGAERALWEHFTIGGR